MIKNYLKIAFRNLQRHKAYSFINISGLAIGMACSILIFLWVQNELSYDRFHTNAPRLYRITANAGDFKVAINPAAMPAGLKQEMPAIKSYVRLTTPNTILFEAGDKKFEEKKAFYADSNFLELFSFPLLKGDRKTALQNPDAVLITKSMAHKYFGKEEALGKMLRINNNRDIVVTGVLENIPPNSHLQFDFIMPMSAIAQTNQNLKTNSWDNFDFYNYLLLHESFTPTTAAIRQFNTQMDEIYKRRVPELKIEFQLQPLTDIHLHSNLQVDLPGHGNILYVKIFSAVAIFILMVACINFMNLATARSARRAKEVGLRKVVGALRAQLIGQFLGESLLISFFSLLLAIILVLLCLPLFNYFTGKDLPIQLLTGKTIFILAGIAIVTGLISGSYPALFLSGFRPANVLKGTIRSKGGNLYFRNALVVVQFIVSIVLLSGTIVVYRQLQYIKNKDLGFDKENLLYMPMTGEIWKKQEALKVELRNNPLTQNFAITSEVPTDITSGTVDVTWEGKDPKLQVVFPNLHVNEDFIDVFKMKMASGRSFSKDFKADTSNFMINEEAARIMGMKPDEAVGKSLTMWERKGTIIGVVKDFNYKPVQRPIEPLIMLLNRWGGNVVVRTAPGQTQATIKALENISTRLNPSFLFSYNFLDQDIDNMYKGEQQLGNLFNIFAVLAIFISCLGLYGLSAFMSEQRIKEIGVRKVLGASVFSIVQLLSSGITRLIAIAMIIAIPISWFAIDNWLKNFAYRIDISWIIFAASSLAALLVAWLTVSYESVKAAITNPIRSLRTE